MNDAAPEYNLYAIRYATRDAMRSQHFMGGDAHDGPMPMDYFMWVAVGEHHQVVIDVGFSREAAEKRGRTFLCEPAESLKLVGVDPIAVSDVILTHLHYDHAGNLPAFPEARFHIQESEMHFATGCSIRHRYFSSGYEVEDIVNVVRLNYARRVMMHKGSAEIVRGIWVEPTPGHSPGQQVVLVNTRRGIVVLASDCVHYYENLQRHRPYPSACNVVEMLESFDKVLQLAGDIDHVIPGHDPLVMQIYPLVSEALAGQIVRLDVAPSGMPARRRQKR